MSSEKVNIAVATLERIFDIEKFTSQVKDELSNFGVKIFLNTEVSKIIQTKDGFNIEIKMVGKKRKTCEELMFLEEDRCQYDWRYHGRGKRYSALSVNC